MNDGEIVKKTSEILETDINNIIPRLKKLKKDVEEQEKEISELEKRA